MTHLGNFASGGSTPRVPHLLSARSVLDSVRAAAELMIYNKKKGRISQFILKRCFSVYIVLPLLLLICGRSFKEKKNKNEITAYGEKKESLKLW